MRKRAIAWAVFIAAFVLLFYAAPGLLHLYSEWSWFKAVGYVPVFWTVFLAKVKLALIVGAFVFAVLAGNALLARALAPRAPWYEIEKSLRQRAAEAMELYVTKFLLLGILLLAALIAYGAAQSAAARWDQYLRFANPVAFGVKEPLLGRDAAFYVFRLPFWRYILGAIYGTLIGAFIISAVVHYLDKAIRVLGGIPAFASHVKAHLSVLLGLILLAKAVGYRLDAYELLYSPRGIVFGPSYTDVYAQLPAYNILLVIAGFCAVLVLVNLYFRGLWLPAVGLGFFLVCSGLLNVVYPALVQRIKVAPNEAQAEAPYIKNNIEFTRRAFDLDRIKLQPFEQVRPLAAADLAKNVETVENVRLWDWRPLRQTYKQLQELRPYYHFSDVDSDRYMLGGRIRQVMLSARHLSPEGIPTPKTWQKTHVLYTHGYGVIVSPVNTVDPSGQPEFMVQDIPPRSTAPEIHVRRPEVYFGELGGEEDYCLVNTTLKEVDYTGADGTLRYSRYEGKGGVPISSGLMRLAMASRFRSLDMFLTRIINSKSRIIFRRNIALQSRAIAPFLLYDADPYTVVGEDGRLYWIHDAYTTSRNYPYSEPFPVTLADGRTYDLNYIRNSVKVVTDAYDGTVTFYLVNTKDPVVRSYDKIYPGLFKPLSEMPEFLLEHLRYPEMLFQAQAQQYATYHMTDPRLFYEREDKWAVAQELGGKGAARVTGTGQHEPMMPYYATMRLPGEDKAEFILMLPYTPINKPNMIAWLCARCDPKHYGQLLVYKFTAQELVDGPQQIEAYIDQDAEVSKDLSLWRQGGSDVIRGNLLVIPIEKSVLYVEPLFLKAQQGEIPELKRIIVFAGGRVAMERTFQDALARVVRGPVPAAVAEAPGAPERPPAVGALAPAEVSRLVEEANARYRKAQERLKAGDFAGYGEEMDALGKVLTRLGSQTR